MNNLKKLNRFNVERFMNAFVASGKTYSLLELARKNVRAGKKVAIVTDRRG